MQVLIAVSGILPASLLGVAAGVICGLVPGFRLLASGGQHLGRCCTFILSQPIAVPSRRRALGGPPAPAAQHRRPDGAGRLETGVPATSLPDHAVLIGTLAGKSLSAWATCASPIRSAPLDIGGLATLVLVLRFGQISMKLGLASRAAADLKPQAVEAGPPRAH